MTFSTSAWPLEVDLQPGKPPLLHAEADGDPLGWATENRDGLRSLVAHHGSVQVRGLGWRDAADFGAVAERLADDLMIEKEAFASREAHSGGVYSSSAWPPSQQMCMHHELSYRFAVPGLMLFACMAAPTTGGTIALADAAAVLEALPVELVDRFDREGWILTRSYTDEIGLPVAEAFGTDDRSRVEQYCRQNAIDFEWQPDGGLRTSQHRRAVIDHPGSGHRCWFNQIAFLNEWTLHPEVREFLVDMYGADGLPFNTRFGNGDPIDEDVVSVVNEVYEANALREPLHDGDLVLVDNIRTAHSRDPFEGSREVLVAMGDEVQLASN